jgi:hypothetical protein
VEQLEDGAVALDGQARPEQVQLGLEPAVRGLRLGAQARGDARPGSPRWRTRPVLSARRPRARIL